jgi:hypothetical protein
MYDTQIESAKCERLSVFESRMNMNHEVTSFDSFLQTKPHKLQNQNKHKTQNTSCRQWTIKAEEIQAQRHQ